MIVQIGFTLISLGVLTTGLEDIVSIRRTTIALVYSPRKKKLAIFFAVALVITSLGTLVTLFTPDRGNTPLSWLLLGNAALLALRGWQTRNVDGSDRMLALVALAGAAYTIIQASQPDLLVWPYIAMLSLLGIAYLDGGLAKLLVPSWRNGRELALVMNLKEFGNRHLARLLLDAPLIARTMSWGVILLETTAGVLLAFGGATAIATAAALTLMHLSIALTMGLGRFFYSFVGGLAVIIGTQQAW